MLVEKFEVAEQGVKVKPFKLRCKLCGVERVVEASKPGYALFTCPSCGAAHLLLLDQDLNLRALELVEAVNALPAGLHELDPDDPSLPATLRETLIKAITARAGREECLGRYHSLIFAGLASPPADALRALPDDRGRGVEGREELLATQRARAREGSRARRVRAPPARALKQQDLFYRIPFFTF